MATAAVCAAATAGVAGCGSSSVSNVVDPVAKAATISNQAPGMRVNLTMNLTTSALPAPITGSGSGSFNLVSHTGSFDLAMNFGNIPQVAAALGSSTFRIDEILDGTVLYLKLPAALAGRNPALHGKPWAKTDLAKAANAIGISGFSSLLNNPASSDPTQFVRYLRATSGHVTKVGTETVDGYQTTHYRARIELSRVPNGFPAAQRAQVRQTITTLEQIAHISAIPVEVWVDGQHLVRREQLSFTETVSGQTVTIGIRVDVPQYGPQPPPQLPPASQVADLTVGAASGSSGAP